MFELQVAQPAEPGAGAASAPQFQFQFHTHAEAPGGGAAGGSESSPEQFQFQFQTQVVGGFCPGTVAGSEPGSAEATAAIARESAVLVVGIVLPEFAA